MRGLCILLLAQQKTGTFSEQFFGDWPSLWLGGLGFVLEQDCGGRTVLYVEFK